MLFSRMVVTTLAVAATASVSHAAVTKAAINPSGWSVGSSNSTYQHWIANGSGEAGSISGTPNNGSDFAGASLASPILSVNGPGYTSGSSGMFYSPTGPYSFEAAISNNNVGAVPANAGTYVIVQVLSLLPDTDSITGMILTNSSDQPLSAGSNPISHIFYGQESGYPTPVGPADVRVDLYEFWVPDFTADFNVLTSVRQHTGILEVRVDTKIVGANVNDAPPFAPVAVPEPATLAVVTLGAATLLLRRRRA